MAFHGPREPPHRGSEVQRRPYGAGVPGPLPKGAGVGGEGQRGRGGAARLPPGPACLLRPGPPGGGSRGPDLEWGALAGA
ncbi:hypothetical protein ABTC13_19605, partial [Acinetobacter baumannii]